MTALNKVLANIIYGSVRLISLFPISLLFFKVSVLRFLAEKILHYRYSVIVQNLSRAFPKKNYAEIKTIAHQFYRHFFEVFAEVIKSQGMSKKDAKEHFHIENPELINDLYGRGINVIALGGHLGNWEWIGLSPLYFNFNVYSLYKPLSSEIMDRVMLRIRERLGLKLLPMQKAGRFILSKTDYPALYFFVGDQNPSHKDAEYCFPFLNQSSYFFAGGAKLAKTTKSAVVYSSMNKIKPGYYSLRFHLISMPEDNKSVQDMLSTYTQLLDQDIRNQPDKWLWSHKRWKNLPD